MPDGNTAISEFIANGLRKGPRNAWVKIPEGEMYLRISQRRIGKMLDIANLSFDTRGTGAFLRYLGYMEDVVRECGDLDGIYVENILNSRLVHFFRRRGYVECDKSLGIPCMKWEKTSG